MRVVLRSVVVADTLEPENTSAPDLEKLLRQRSVFRLNECFTGEFFRDTDQRLEVTYVDDVRSVMDCWSDCVEDINTPHMLARPIRRFPGNSVPGIGAGKILGVVCLRPLKPFTLSSKEKTQLERFANHVAVIMDQIRYRRRYQQIETLKDQLPGLQLSNLREFYAGVVKLVRDALAAEACSYFILNPEEGLVLKATSVEKAQRLTKSGEWEELDTDQCIDTVIYQADEVSITRRIAEKRKTTLIYNVYSSRHMSKTFMEVTQTGDHKSLIGAPIIQTDGTVLGILRCINKKKKGTLLPVFVQGDRDFLGGRFGAPRSGGRGSSHPARFDQGY